MSLTERSARSFHGLEADHSTDNTGVAALNANPPNDSLEPPAGGIDLQKERLIPLTTVPKLLPPGPSGKTTHVSTVFRWTNQPEGLEYLQCGGRRCTSVEALQRFFERLTGRPGHRALAGPVGRSGRIAKARRQLHQMLGPGKSRTPCTANNPPPVRGDAPPPSPLPETALVP